MAIKYVITALMCLALAQELSAQLGFSCGFQIQQLRSEISIAAQTSGREISAARMNIKSNIGLARSDIQIQAESLRMKADLAAGVNAGLCRRQLDLDLAQINDQAFNLCYYDAKFNLLNQQVNQINNLKGVASQICTLCAQEATCVAAKVQDVQKQVADLQGGISAGVAGVTEDSNGCVGEAQNSQSKVIKNASDNLDACLGSA